jgi:Intracellular proteinase inhibitor
LAPGRERTAPGSGASEVIHVVSDMKLRRLGTERRMMVRYQHWLGGLLFMAVVGSGGSTGAGNEGPGPQSSPLSLEVRSSVKAGETVALALKWKNVEKHPISLTLGGNPAYDFVVTRPDGVEVWRWSHGQVRQDILGSRTIEPGMEVVFEAEWPQRDNDNKYVPPGAYSVRGILNMEPPEKLETPPKPLTVTPG